jgi:large subunit ribosomal protein L24
MNRIKFHVKKGDDVIVLTGNHRGATGKVLHILVRKNQVLIEGVRMIKRHQRKTQDDQGGIVQREGPIHISNVKVVAKPDKKADKKAAAKKEKQKTPRAKKPKASEKA